MRLLIGDVVIALVGETVVLLLALEDDEDEDAEEETELVAVSGCSWEEVEDESMPRNSAKAMFCSRVGPVDVIGGRLDRSMSTVDGSDC